MLNTVLFVLDYLVIKSIEISNDTLVSAERSGRALTLCLCKNSVKCATASPFDFICASIDMQGVNTDRIIMKQNVAVVLPIYNESSVIAQLVAAVEVQIDAPLEFVLINDGSTDDTLAVLKTMQTTNAETRKKIVDLSRNFGHQTALMAGLAHVSMDADVVLVMDADFQDNPADIPALLAKLEDGYDCVYARRTSNTGSRLFDVLTKVFYNIQQKMLTFSIPRHAGTFCAFNRTVLERILEFQEAEIYFPGLRAYVGMKQVGVPVERSPRAHGDTKVGKMGLINLSLAGILGFSALPMRLIFLFGLLITSICFFLGVVVFFMKIFGITKIMGITTLLIVIFGLFGIQIIFIGVIGEYLGKLFLESKRRPRWVVRKVFHDEK